jgi:hypothetical protein
MMHAVLSIQLEYSLTDGMLLRYETSEFDPAKDEHVRPQQNILLTVVMLYFDGIFNTEEKNSSILFGTCHSIFVTLQYSYVLVWKWHPMTVTR